MWSRLPARFVARMLAGHSVLGLAAAALLYIVCLSGTLMVFHAELQRWEQPAVPEFVRVSPTAVQRAAQQSLDSLETPPHVLAVLLPTESLPRLTVFADGRSWYADAEGNPVAAVDTPWSEFLEHLHYYLTLPDSAGLVLVGILGVLMLALVLSGVLAHPRLFRDAFRLRHGASLAVREADWHNRLSVWGLPFHLTIALTGAALGLAIAVAALLAPAFYGGDSARVFAPIFGSEPVPDSAPAPLAETGTALRNLRHVHPGVNPYYLSIHEPATAGQSLEIVARQPTRLIYGETYRFAPDGSLTGHLGLSDGPAGRQAIAAVYPLHFGTFGGLPVRLAYGLLGFLSCVVTVTGVNIWLIKRRRRGRPVPLLERAWHGVVWGVPAALALTLPLLRLWPGAGFGTIAFWGLAVLAVFIATRVPGLGHGRILPRLAAVAVSLAVLTELLAVPPASLSAANWLVNTVLLATAVWLWVRKPGGRIADRA